jgi:DNA repair protein RadC
MAAAEHHSTRDRPDSSATFFDIGSRFSRFLATLLGGLAVSNRHDSYCQPIRATSDAGRLRDWAGALGIPSICHDFWSNDAVSTQHEAKLLTAALGHDCSSTIIASLLAQFGTIGGILSADFPELVKVTGSVPDAAKLDAIRAMAMRFVSTHEASLPIIDNSHVLIRYLQDDMGKLRVETFRVIFLDAHNRLIANEIMWTGTPREVQVHPREVMRRALEIDCSAIIVAHNHPSKVLEPSGADIAMTKTLIQSAHILGLVLHDHLIVSSHGFHSMRMQKTIDPWE